MTKSNEFTVSRNVAKISDSSIAFNVITLKTDDVSVPIPPAHRIYVIDGSGSMYGSMPTLRENLKDMIANSARVGDMLSVVRFSSTGEYNTVFGNHVVSTSADLKSINGMIDKGLYASGCTTFVGPLSLVDKLISVSAGKYVNTIMFMTDGYDNSGYNMERIVADFAQRSNDFALKTVVEYGNYANRNLLMKIAETIGARYIFSDDVEAFSSLVEADICGDVYGALPVSIDLPNATDKTIALTTKPLMFHTVKDGKVSVIPYDNAEIFWISEAGEDEDEALAPSSLSDDCLAALYRFAGYYAMRLDTDAELNVLRAIGDVAVTRSFTNAFSKQDYSNYSAHCDAIADSIINGHRGELDYEDGYNPNSVPADDVPCVVNLLLMLSEMSAQANQSVMIDLDALDYKRIGRKRLYGLDSITDKIEKLSETMKTTRDPKTLMEIAVEISKLSEQAEGVKFIPNSSVVPLHGLTWNENRANVSTRIKRDGYVVVPESKQKELNLPAYLPTHTFRNFAIVSDGVVNVKKLPLIVSQEVADKLIEGGYVKQVGKDGHVTIDLSQMPVINNKIVKTVREMTAKEIARLQLELLIDKGRNNVINHFTKLANGSGPAMLKTIETYGETASEWLKAMGVTDNGYSKPSKTAPSEDYYMSREISIALKGMSSIDSVNALKKRIDKGMKMNPVQSAMCAILAKIEPMYERYEANKELAKDFPEQLKKIARDLTLETREKIKDMAETKFAILVGHVWFKGESDLNETKGEVDGVDYTITIKEGKINI